MGWAGSSGFNGAAPMMERKTGRRPGRDDAGEGFNGAAPMMERKTPTSPAGSASASRLQWGRSDDGAENTPGVCSVKNPESFNGAAPMMERKTTDLLTGDERAHALQWGRSDDGAENMDARTNEIGYKRASMGPLR